MPLYTNKRPRTASHLPTGENGYEQIIEYPKDQIQALRPPAASLIVFPSV
jgi:hypothetical protein